MKQSSEFAPLSEQAFFLSVNVSAGMLDALHRANVAGTRVCMEITESVLIRREDAVLRQFSILRAAGVGVALDDFGAGYSSIAYLRQLPVDRPKLDHAVVAGLTADA